VYCGQPELKSTIGKIVGGGRPTTELSSVEIKEEQQESNEILTVPHAVRRVPGQKGETCCLSFINEHIHIGTEFD